MSNDRKKLPAPRGRNKLAKRGGKAGAGTFLDKVRNAKAAPPRLRHAAETVDPALVAAALKPPGTRPRLVFAIDATASREHAWKAAKQTTDTLVQALPGELDVALAVHGGSEIKLFTSFTSNAATLRDHAAGTRCEAGRTRLVEIMDRTREAGGVRVLVYIGDAFEESLDEAEQAAVSLRLRGTRVIILHDAIPESPEGDPAAQAFARIASITGGTVLPFDRSSVERLRELLAAIATLAVGGLKLLERRVDALPAAGPLLRLLGETGA
jgi:hypothetical protein